MRHLLRLLAIVVPFLLHPGTVQAQSVAMGCNVASPSDLFTNFCYDSMFPLIIAGEDVIPPNDVDAPYDAVREPVCWCDGPFDIQIPGYPEGNWVPISVIETTRSPGCSPMLGGLNLGSTLGAGRRTGGTGGTAESGSLAEGGFRQFNLYDFPLSSLFATIVGSGSADLGTSDDSYMSSLFLPFWDDEALSNLLFPEAAAFENPVAMIAAPLDCAAEMASGLASIAGAADDAMFWWMGCWGATYPLTGNFGNKDVTTGSSLVAAKVMYTMNAMARYGAVNSKYGMTTVGEAVVSGACSPVPMPVMNKSEYKMTMMFPVSEAGDSVSTDSDPSLNAGSINPVSFLENRCAHSVGSSEYLWGLGRKVPGTGEDEAYLVWRWVDHCEL